MPALSLPHTPSPLGDVPVSASRRPAELHSDPGPGAAPLPGTPAALEPPGRGASLPGAWRARVLAAGTPPSAQPQHQLPRLQLHLPSLAVDQPRSGPCLSPTQSPTEPLRPPRGRQWGQRTPRGRCHPRAGHRKPAPSGRCPEAAGALPVPVAEVAGLEVGPPRTRPVPLREL